MIICIQMMKINERQISRSQELSCQWEIKSMSKGLDDAQYKGMSETYVVVQRGQRSPACSVLVKVPWVEKHEGLDPFK